MSAFVLLCAAALTGGLWLLHIGWRKAAAAVLAAAIALSLAVAPRPAASLALRESPRLRAWAAPRRAALEASWRAASAAFGLGVGLATAFLRRDGGRKRGWESPGALPGLDAATRRALDQAGAGTFLGLSADGREVRLPDAARDGHMQVVGPTRSGKSQLLFALAGQDMRRGMPLLFMEAKGDRGDFDQFLALAARAGRARDVRYFNPQDPRSMSFNPIRPVPGQDATAVANQIARAIGREPTSSGEGQDYYRAVDYAKVQNMAEVFWSTGREFTLRDCFHYFASSKARERAFKLCPDADLVAMAQRELEGSPDTTALVAALRPWATGPLGELLNSCAPQLLLEDVFAAGRLAYLAVPLGHLQVLANPLGRMVISGLLSIAAWRQQAVEKPGPAAVILDEFAEFATPAFASFIATVGSARLWTTLSHQDLGQLKKVQGMDADAFHSAVFNNTSGCKVCFRSPDPEDAEFWASTLGTYETFEDTERVSTGWLGVRHTGDKSRRAVDRFKVHPNKLKDLRPGTALVFSPGHEDCLARTARVYRLGAGAPPALPEAPALARPGLALHEAVRRRPIETAATYDAGGDLS